MALRNGINFSNRHLFAILLLILFLGAIMRFYGLGKENFWIDEGVTVYNAHQSIIHNFKWSFTLAYLPLYHMILSAWEKVFGLSEFSMRSLSSVFGILSIFMIYEIAAFMYGKKVGMYAALILALSPFHVYYSQEARVYTLFVFTALISIYYYLKYIKNHDKKDLIYYIISSIALLNIFNTAIFILAFQNIHYFLFIRKRILKWILTQSFIGLFFLPIFILTLKMLQVISESLFVEKPSLMTLAKTFYMFSAGLTFNTKALIAGGILSMIFFLLIIYVVKDEIRNMIKKKYKGLEKTSFLVLWGVFPIFLLSLQSYILTSLYFEKYVIASSAAMYIFAALAISRLKNSYRIFALAAIVLLSCVILIIDFKTNNKGDWYGVANFVKESKNESDGMIINARRSLYPFMYYFDRNCFESPNLEDCAAKQNIYGVLNIGYIPKNALKNEKIFLLLYNDEYTDPEGKIVKLLEQDHRITEEKDFQHIKIFVFEKQVT